MRRAILAVVGLFACSAVHAQITTSSGARGSAAPGGSGGGDDHSVIGNAIRALSDDQWGTVSDVGTFDPDPGKSNDSVFSYAQRGTYYDGKIYSFGGVHGSGGSETMFLNVYDLDSNTWVYQVHWPNDDDLYEHGFYNGTVDRTNGDFLGHNTYGAKTLKRWQLARETFGDDISAPTNGMPSSGPFYALEWHPNLSSGALVWANEWDIAYRPARTGKWTELDATPPAAQNLTIVAYNRKDDAVYIGGRGDILGETTNHNALQKVTAAGLLVARADSPVPFGVWDATATSTAMLLASGNSANKLLAISRDKNIYEYDDSDNRWSGVIDTVPSGLISGGGVAQTGADCFFVTIDDDGRNIHGIVVFKLATPTTMSSTVHLWKR